MHEWQHVYFFKWLVWVKIFCACGFFGWSNENKTMLPSMNFSLTMLNVFAKLFWHSKSNWKHMLAPKTECLAWRSIIFCRMTNVCCTTMWEKQMHWRDIFSQHCVQSWVSETTDIAISFLSGQSTDHFLANKKCGDKDQSNETKTLICVWDDLTKISWPQRLPKVVQSLSVVIGQQICSVKCNCRLSGIFFSWANLSTNIEAHWLARCPCTFTLETFTFISLLWWGQRLLSTEHSCHWHFLSSSRWCQISVDMQLCFVSFLGFSGHVRLSPSKEHSNQCCSLSFRQCSDSICFHAVVLDHVQITCSG